MNEKYTVIYSPEALDDIRKIYSYIAFELKAPGTAKNQTDRIRKFIRSLDFMPMRHPIVEWEPWKSMKMHKAPVNNYVVYYIVNDEQNTVTIIRIFYGGRDVQNIIDTDNE